MDYEERQLAGSERLVGTDRVAPRSAERGKRSLAATCAPTEERPTAEGGLPVPLSLTIPSFPSERCDPCGLESAGLRGGLAVGDLILCHLAEEADESEAVLQGLSSSTLKLARGLPVANWGGGGWDT
ncbi:MAG: hypothetical protein SGPRY_006513 [Prymnesium sp.]